MAEIIGLDIVMGMDVQEVQAELQKAQNQLRQFEAQLKKSTNTTEIAMLNKEIGDLNKTIGNLEQGMKRIGKPTGDATQSLVNLSRIAQDAPYGFMGIANNLNPMLESFQQLSKKSEGAGGALKAMAAGLMGPAGLGLALGVASSLIVKFGDDIADFFEKLIKGEDETKLFKQTLAGIGGEFTSAAEKVEKVRTAFDLYHNGIMSGNEALKIYNKELGENFGVKSNINEAEEVFKNKTAAYIEASLQRALADQASKKAAEELLKQKIEAKKSTEDYKNITDYFVPGGGISTSETREKVAKKRQQDAIDTSEKLINDYRQIANDAKAVETLYENGFNFSLDPEKSKKGGGQKQKPIDQLKEEGKELNLELDAIKRRLAKAKADGLKMVDTYEDPEEAANKENKRLAGIKKFGESKLGKIAGEGMKGKGSPLLEEAQKENDLQKANIALAKEKQEAYEKFAETVSSTLTNSIMGLWDAFEQGKDVGEALSNMFMDLAKQIAAAAIKAAIFSTILNVIAPGSGAAAGAAKGGGMGFFDSFKKILGLAEGGIVNKPTLAMVGEGNQSEAVMPLSKLGSMMQNTFDAGAMSGTGGGGGGQFTLRGSDLVLALNRSNYSLNLRRGS